MDVWADDDEPELVGEAGADEVVVGAGAGDDEVVVGGGTTLVVVTGAPVLGGAVAAALCVSVAA